LRCGEIRTNRAIDDGHITQPVEVEIGAERGAIVAIRLDADHGCAGNRRNRAAVPAEIGADIDEQAGLLRHDLPRQVQARRLVMTGPKYGPADVIGRVYRDRCPSRIVDTNPAGYEASRQPREDTDLRGVLEPARVGDQRGIDPAHAFRWGKL